MTDRFVRISDRLGNLDPFKITGEDPVWTPTGDLVVVRRTPSWSESELWLVDRSGQDIRRLDVGGDSVLVTNPAVSPDGQTVAYERLVSGERSAAIYTAPISGGGEQRLSTAHTRWVQSVDWSPDGTRLLFVADDALWTMAVDGSQLTQLVQPSALVRQATWSPDGSFIAYSTVPDGRLHLLEVATGVSTTLVLQNLESVAAGHGFDWQPLPACSIEGTSAADFLTGTPGDDIICAGNGDDMVQETAGDDIVFGGNGQDLVGYDPVGPGVQVNLERMRGHGQGEDMHLATEGALGTGGADKLTGDHDAETFVGRAGGDNIAGGMSADTLAGGPGRDTLTSNYDEVLQHTGYSIDLVAGTSVEEGLTGQPVSDSLSGFEDVVGTPDQDLIRANGANNRLSGSPRNGELGDDGFEGRGGDDTIIGSGTAIYTAAPFGVDVDLVQGTAKGGDGSDTLSGIWAAQGSAHDDHFRLTPGAIAYGNAGDDSAEFTRLAHFHGGRGADRAILSAMPWGVLVYNDIGRWDRWPDSGIPYYQMTGVERFVLTPFQDVFHGSADSEIVFTGAGDDWLAPGPQSVTGPHGPVRDRLWGGVGLDTLNARWLSGPFVVDLGEGWGQAPDVDVVRDFEDVLGSEYADRIMGSDGSNNLKGFGGSDTLRGRLGPDHLDGGLGADALHGGPGLDRCRSDQQDNVTSCP